jgi:hypothetical protein
MLNFCDRTTLITALVPAAIAAASGLLGVIVGGWITARNQRRERQHNRVREQLQDFYSPLSGMRARIHAKQVSLHKLTEASHATFNNLAALPSGASPDVHFKYVDGRVPDFAKMMDENNRQVSEEIIPLYRQMVEHFSTHIYLAEDSTRQHFDTLVEVAETLDRLARKTLPLEVAATLSQDPEKLKPFYQDLETQLAQLRRQLDR